METFVDVRKYQRAAIGKGSNSTRLPENCLTNTLGYLAFRDPIELSSQFIQQSAAPGKAEWLRQPKSFVAAATLKNNQKTDEGDSQMEGSGLL